MNFVIPEIKPRLRRKWSLLCKRFLWFCEGAGYSGTGASLRDAYWDWRARCNEDSLGTLQRKSS